MGRINSRARQLSNARKIQAKKHNDAPRLQQLNTINTYLESLSFENLQQFQIKVDDFKNEIDSNETNNVDVEKLREKLIENIKCLPINQVKAAYYLFQKMRYPKGKNKGEILSIYI